MKLAITGVGIVSPLGNTLSENINNLKTHFPGFRSTTALLQVSNTSQGFERKLTFKSRDLLRVTPLCENDCGAGEEPILWHKFISCC